jgi:hypothetical protein
MIRFGGKSVQNWIGHITTRSEVFATWRIPLGIGRSLLNSYILTTTGKKKIQHAFSADILLCVPMDSNCISSALSLCPHPFFTTSFVLSHLCLFFAFWHLLLVFNRAVLGPVLSVTECWRYNLFSHEFIPPMFRLRLGQDQGQPSKAWLVRGSHRNATPIRSRSRSPA